MASPNWKSYHHNVIQDSAMIACQPVETISPNNMHTNGTVRENGVIEKLLHSYGFIQCCERQDRLFFHYSQYQDNIEHANLGDPVEFEMTYDRRTGKPIASNVVKLSAELIPNNNIICEDRVTGTITTEILDADVNSQGRISYENRGECFFLPYTRSDLIESNSIYKIGDVVTFQISTDHQSGSLHARNIKLDKTDRDGVYEGVICALKESFGFIERADIVKEIFFHCSECEQFKDMKLGDDVQFGIQTRNNKEVAINIERLPEGAVIFEDVDLEFLLGRITKPIERSAQVNKHQNDPFPGMLVSDIDNIEVEFPFGEKDINGDYTLFGNDQVHFNVAIDRRDNMKRATNIRILMDESFSSSDEDRENGIIFTVKEGFGFIKCANRDQPRLFFHFNEIIDSEFEIKVQDEVEFFVSPDAAIPNRQNAIRIRRLPRGSVILENHLNRIATHNGTIESEPNGQLFRNKANKEDDDSRDIKTGIITYYNNNILERINYTIKDCANLKNVPKTDDKVEFNISNNGMRRAIDIKILGGRKNFNMIKNGLIYDNQGFIAALRENFGFIETKDHSREIFFHYSIFDGDSNKLELGQEVEYVLSQKCTGNNSGKLSAEGVRKIPNGTIPSEEVVGEVMTGVIVRPIRCFNPDQDEYAGLIEVKGEEEESNTYKFGITSLLDKKIFVQSGDVVEFQLGVHAVDGSEWAVNIKTIRDRFKATVEAIKGQYGFLSHEIDEGKKLFFHKSEVKDNSQLKQGDIVDFVIIKNYRNGRSSACDVKLVSDNATSSPRPEHLTRLRNLSLSQDDSTPRLIAIRQPAGPDNDNNFKNHPMQI